MVINWYGEGCFKISEGPLTIMTDPFDSSTGLSVPRFKADIVIKTLLKKPEPESQKPLSYTEDDGTHVIAGPGEFEIKGIHVNGWPLMKDSAEDYLKSVFRIQFGEMNIGLLGHIAQFNEPEIFEELGDIDILIVPGGNAPFISEDAAAKLVRQIEPRLVIPSFFKVAGLKRKANEVNDFLKELGHANAPVQDKLTIKKKDLNPEKMEVAVLRI